VFARERKRNRVLLQFNFTGASTREAFTSAEGTDLLVPPPHPTPSKSRALTSLFPSVSLASPPFGKLSPRFLKVTRNLAGFPPEFRLNIIHVTGGLEWMGEREYCRVVQQRKEVQKPRRPRASLSSFPRLPRSPRRRA